MKKHLLILSAVLAGFTFLPSCSDDDNNQPPVAPALEEATFTETDGLTLTVDGAPMLGKEVKVTPSEDGKKATITMSSTFDLSAIPNYTEGMIQGDKIQAPGVIPGSPVTTIEVLLNQKDDAYTFSGTDESTYCTFAYSGTLKENTLNLTISDVTLKNKTLAGTTWNLNTIDPDDYTADYNDGPIHIVWEPYYLDDPDSSASVDLGFMKMPVQTLLQMVTVMPMLENPADPEGEAWSVTTMMNYLLKSITFKEDGNIIAEYADIEGNGAYTTSPVNLIQYVIKEDGKLLVFLNPQAIIAADTKAVDLEQILKTVMGNVLPMLANGVEVDYTLSGNSLSLYLGTQTLLPLVKGAVLPILKDEEMMAMLLQLISDGMGEDESMASMIPLIQGALQSMPAAIEKTTAIEIGLNFTKK